MAGRPSQDQGQLFYSFCLDDAVPGDHRVREIAAVLYLSWVHVELAASYSTIGRPSIDPVLMLRMLILGCVFAIRSERALCPPSRGRRGEAHDRISNRGRRSPGRRLLQQNLPIADNAIPDAKDQTIPLPLRATAGRMLCKPAR